MTNIKELAMLVCNTLNISGSMAYEKLVIKEAFAELAKQSEPVEIDWPEYHDEAMGCGLEDRNITDRYEAMRHGWDCAIERCAEAIPEVIYTNPLPQPDLVAEIERLSRINSDLCRTHNQRLIDGARFEEQIAELRQQLSAAEKEMMMLRDALNLLYSWANNWDSEFMNDPDWKNRDLLIVQKALVITGD